MALDAARLSTAMYTAWTTNSNNGFVPTLTTDMQNIIKALCDSVASSVVAEIATNADVVIPAGSASSGIQYTPSPNSANTACSGPISDKTLSSVVR